MSRRNLTEFIKDCALKLGFDIVGIAPAEPLVEDGERLKNWLEKGFHADMDYMKRNFELRINPTLHLESAKSIIMLGVNYFNKKAVSEAIQGISIYARGYDYHKILKEKMQTLLKKVTELTMRNLSSKIFVDSSPILERALAVRAGLGQFGKNSCVINKQYGSFFFICGIIIDLELAYDTPMAGSICGRCTKCIDACPTGAIIEQFCVDSRLCISYHTIENRKKIPESISRKMNGWIFGCDICQQVCPWNRRAKETEEKGFLPEEKIRGLSLKDILTLKEEEFHRLFSKTPLKRAGWRGFMRNVMIAAKNSGC